MPVIVLGPGRKGNLFCPQGSYSLVGRKLPRRMMNAIMETCTRYLKRRRKARILKLAWVESLQKSPFDL